MLKISTIGLTKSSKLIIEKSIISLSFQNIVEEKSFRDFQLNTKTKEVNLLIVELSHLSKNEYNEFIKWDFRSINFKVICIVDYKLNDNLKMLMLELSNKGLFNYCESKNINELFFKKLLIELSRRKKIISELGFESIHNDFIKIEPSSETTKLIAIGASTGGPEALSSLFKQIKYKLSVPIIIVLHINKNFVKSIVSSLNRVSSLNFMIAENDTELIAGNVYLAPSEKHLRVTKENEINKIILTDEEPDHHIKPSINFMFDSVAKTYDSKATGIVLTGLGRDGTEGAKVIKEHDGKIFVQDKNSSLIHSMPKSIIDAGLSDEELSIEQIADYINTFKIS